MVDESAAVFLVTPPVLTGQRIQWPFHATLSEPREPVTEAEVVAHLARSRKPLSLREIAAALDLRHSGRRALVKLARKMKKRGEIHEYPNAASVCRKKNTAPNTNPPVQRKKGRIPNKKAGRAGMQRNLRARSPARLPGRKQIN